MPKRFIAVVSGLAVAGAAFATDYTWSGGSSGDWTAPANWGVASGYPVAGDTATFNADVTITTSTIDLGGTAGTSDRLVLSIASGKTLTIDVPITGNGGVERSGDGALALKRTNPFKGMFVSRCTSAQTLGRTYVYASDALGTDSADFDYDKKNYAPLYLDAGGATLTNSYPVYISRNADKMENGLHFSNGKFVFLDKVTARSRLDIGSDDNVTEVRFEDTLSCGSWNDMAFPAGCDVYFGKCFKNNSGNWYTTSSSCTFHFCESNNSWGVWDTWKIAVPDLGTAYYTLFKASWSCETTDVFVAQTKAKCFGWAPTCGDNSRIRLNGFDQKFPVMIYGCVSTGSNYGFESPEGKPAQVILEGAYATDIVFNGKFFGTAGLKWNPSTDYAFVLTGRVSTTTGTIDVGHGRVRLAKGASFTQLGRLNVASGATFTVDENAGDAFLASAATVAEGGRVEVADGVTLTFLSLTTGGKAIADGNYAASALDGFSGEGLVVVSTSIRENVWSGGSSGLWDVADNWSAGLPAAGDRVKIDGSKTVYLTATTPLLASLSLSGAAKLVVSNWNTRVEAGSISLAGTSQIAVSGFFTNELHKSRIHLKCHNLSLALGTKLDADKKGWSGGLLKGPPSDNWGNLPNPVVNDAGLSRGGWGPGTGTAAYMPASHLGRGGYLSGEGNALLRCYDDPYAPTEPGSGGYGLGSEAYTVYKENTATTSNGGGAVRIEATGKVTVDGQILASAGGACTHWFYSNGKSSCNGGGSGGSVYITCSQIAGSGEIRADGGNGNYANSGYTEETKLVSYPNFPGGGGGIAIVYDPDKQSAGACSGMTISAAGGTFDGIHTSDTQNAPLIEGTKRGFGTMDRYHTDAEPGTLYFSDAKIVADTIGSGLSGRIVGLAAYTHDGDLDLTSGHVRFATTGVTVRVTGNLRVTGENARLDIGGVYTVTNFAALSYVTAGDKKVSLTVDGDLTVSNGAALAVYAGATGVEAWGGEVTVGGAFTIGKGGHVYPTADFGNGGSPRFLACSFTLEEGGEVDADWRGGSGGWSGGVYTYERHTSGIGPVLATSPVTYGYGDESVSAGHGGAGTISLQGNSPRYASTNYGKVCDDPYLPIYAGPGGGSGGYGRGGAGGGIFHLTATGAVTVAGTISANALGPEKSDYNCYYQGAGAGGTIYLAGATVTGASTAKLSARGGNSTVANLSNNVAAGGGGGRISIWGGADLQARGLSGKAARHSTTPTFEANKGQIVWEGSTDVGGGTNVLKAAGIEQYPATHGGAGTVYFNMALVRHGLVIYLQ